MKIEFKKLDQSIDLKKVFPIISEEDYALLAGSSLIIPDKEYEKIEKKGFIPIGDQQVSVELIRVVNEEGFCPIQRKIMKDVEKTFLYGEDVVDVLFKAVKLQKNVILWGRGGHNKSEGTIQTLQLMKEEGLISSDPFIMSFGDGLTEEVLLGGINIKKFKDTGELEYLFKNSFMEHEIVIFEELFDAPPQVLLSLKDILTSGYCRKGNQVHKIKTKVVIGLTNKSKEDFAEDDSLEALVQRFALTLKVEWPSYSKNDFNKLFSKIYEPAFVEEHKFKLNELAEIIAQNNAAKQTFVSPRTAKHAADLYTAGGNLKLISDIDPVTLDAYYKANKDSEKERADEKMFNNIEKYIADNGINSSDATLAILNMVLEDQRKRTGEDIKIDGISASSTKTKISKIKYIIALANLHNWSAKNMQKAKDLISDLKRKEEELSKL